MEDFRLSFKAKKPSFADSKSSTEMQKLDKGPVIPNTEECTTCAVCVFEEWYKQRNTLPAEEKYIVGEGGCWKAKSLALSFHCWDSVL